MPQGGGHPSGHRCPGESLTLRLLSETIRVLAGLDLEVTPGATDAARMPTLPAGSNRVRVERPTREWPDPAWVAPARALG